jgi:hypothetical protein
MRRRKGADFRLHIFYRCRTANLNSREGVASLSKMRVRVDNAGHGHASGEVDDDSARRFVSANLH